MKQHIENFRKFWIEDFSFILLLFILVFVVFVLPSMMSYIPNGDLILNINLLLLFFIGIFSAIEKKWIVATSILFSSHLILKLIRFSNLPLDFYIIEKYISLLNIVVFIIINFRLLFRDQSVNSFRIIGAVNVYLLFGLMGSIVFEIIDSTFQNSLSVELAIDTNEANYPTFIYYSFVCLTTVGFGDIIPLNPITKMFSVFLSALGILYPAVVIARLMSYVNLKTENEQNRKSN